MATPFFSISSNTDPNTPSYTRPALRPDPNPNPAPSPKPRGRKGGGKSQNGNKNKTPQRGVGIAELERLRHLDEQQPLPPPPPPPTTTTHHSGARPMLDSRVNPFHHGNPLSGVPVIRCCLPGQPIPDPRFNTRVGIPELSELPSMPNPFHLDHHFKKKRMIGEDVVGFTKGYSGNFGGFDLKNGDKNNHFLALNNGASFSSALPTTTTGSEVVAIHRKWTGSGNVMMEYGFFPGKSEEHINNGQQDNMKFGSYNNNNINNNYYYNNNNKMEDLSLKVGLFSDSSLSSPSSSSSFSSLTTATTTTTCNSSVDLSLKLSSF